MRTFLATRSVKRWLLVALAGGLCAVGLVWEYQGHGALATTLLGLAYAASFALGITLSRVVDIGRRF